MVQPIFRQQEVRVLKVLFEWFCTASFLWKGTQGCTESYEQIKGLNFIIKKTDGSIGLG